MPQYPPNLEDSWHDECFYYGNNGSKYKRSLITPGQIYSIIERIKFLRSKKDYQKADLYRDKLCSIGYYWEEPKVFTKDNLMGHTHNKLKFMVYKSGELSIEGYIHEGNTLHNCEIYYITNL